MVQWMDYMCKLWSLGNSCTASWSSHLVGMVGSSYSYFFRVRCNPFCIHSSLRTFFLLVFVLFFSCCSHTQVFGRTLVKSSTIPIAILKGPSFFFARRNGPYCGKCSPSKNYTMIIIIIIIIIILSLWNCWMYWEHLTLLHRLPNYIVTESPFVAT